MNGKTTFVFPFIFLNITRQWMNYIGKVNDLEMFGFDVHDLIIEINKTDNMRFVITFYSTEQRIRTTMVQTQSVDGLVMDLRESLHGTIMNGKTFLLSWSDPINRG